MYQGETKRVGKITEIPESNVRVTKINNTTIRADKKSCVPIYINGKRRTLVIIPKALPCKPKIITSFKQDRVFFILQRAGGKDFVTVYNINPYSVTITADDHVIPNLYIGMPYTFEMSAEEFYNLEPKVEKSLYPERDDGISCTVKDNVIHLENDDEEWCTALVSYVIVKGNKIVKSVEKEVPISGCYYTDIIEDNEQVKFLSLTGRLHS